ncbi:MAG: glycosyltransferase family 2 protein [Desulfomonilaceae bacterium]
MNDNRLHHEGPKSPEVTVLMAVYNGERFLRPALESILNQTFRDFEFLIINDGSSDGTRDILASYDDSRIRVIDNDRNIGHARSLNRGLAVARGEYIARQDADDISHSERLEQQVGFMRKNSSVVVLGTQVKYLHGDGKRTRFVRPGKPVSGLAAKFCLMFSPPNPVAHPTVMFRRSIIWDKYGGYDPNYAVCEDAELWCRIGMENVIENLPATLVTIRVHSGSLTADPSHPRRKQDYSLSKRLLPEVMKSVLNRSDIPNEWGESWVQMHDPSGSPDIDAVLNFVQAVDILREMFFEVHPEGRGNQEIRLIAADVKMYVALHLAKQKHTRSVAVLLQVLRTDPLLAIQYLPKFLALLVFGNSAIRFYKKLKAMRSLS